VSTVINWLGFAGFVWCIGAGAGWWPGPIAYMKSWLHEVKERRSEAVSSDDDDEPGDFMNGGRGEPGLPTEELPPRSVTLQWTPEHLQRYGTGPRPLEAVRASAGMPSTDDGLAVPAELRRQPGEGRRAWVARVVADGRLRATEVDELGKSEWKVTTRTIAADRAELRKDAEG
jgi:hypothetical protein